MRIGKTIKVGISPKRVVKKFNENTPRPIPVELPQKEKVPEKAEYQYRYMWGVSPLTQLSDLVILATGS